MWWESCVFASLCTCYVADQRKSGIHTPEVGYHWNNNFISPIMLSSEHKSGVFNSYWRMHPMGRNIFHKNREMHPMGRNTNPWTHPRKHPNNSQKGSVVAFGMTKKTGFLASQDTDLINHKTPDCALSKTQQVQFFAGSWSTWPLLSQNYIESYSPLPARYKCHWQ